MKHTPLKKKLIAYTAAACAVTIIKKSDAQIVYTDISDVTIAAYGNSDCGLDLNNDGHVDFKLHMGETTGIYYASLDGFNQGMGTPEGTPNAWMVQLHYGQKIDSQKHWYLLDNYNKLLAYSAYGSLAGPWNGGAVDGYLGLRFKDGDIYYGWVRVDLTSNAVKMKIKDYAYNSVPGAPIKAGDTGGNGCPDNFEPNNSVEAAKLVPLNSFVTIQLNQAGDEDWFYFVTKFDKNNVRISLYRPPADYDLQLFDSDQNLVGQSTNSGHAGEEIIQNEFKGGYIRVYGKNNASSPNHCFTLLVETKENSFREASQSLSENDVTVFPNPAADQLTISGLSTDDPSELFISGLNGDVLKTIPVNAPVQHVNVEDLAVGMYFLYLRNSSEQRVIKFIISR